MFQNQGVDFDTRMEQTQGLRVIQLLRLTANENVEKMAKFKVKTTIDVYSPKNWNF